MKKLVSIILVLAICTLSGFSIGEEGFLPSLDEVLGVPVPLVEWCLDVSPTDQTRQEDGRVVEQFEKISFDDYVLIGQHFNQSGFKLVSSDFQNDVIHLVVRKDKGEVDFYYNVLNLTLKVVYPKYYTKDRSATSIGDGISSLFPDIEKLAGPILPRFSAALMREPDSSARNKAGKLIEEYRNFTESDYQAVSKYLLDSGCSVVNYSRAGNVLTIDLEKSGSPFLMKYDPEKQSAIVEYGDSDYIEPVVTSTPIPTATPKPTLSPDEYNSYAALFVGIVKSTMKKPDSMEVHSIRVMGYQEDTYIVIDFSGMNGFGGYVRDKYSFKFEKGHISLSGDSSDYDTYENHSSEFYLIKTLDVDDVLRLVK